MSAAVLPHQWEGQQGGKACILQRCPTCGRPLVHRFLGEPGRPRDRHAKCAYFEDAMQRIEKGIEDIAFDASPDSIVAQRDLRRRFFAAANTLNGTIANGGAGTKRRVVHYGMGDHLLCGKQLAHEVPLLGSVPAGNTTWTKMIDLVTCKTCLRRLQAPTRLPPL